MSISGLDQVSTSGASKALVKGIALIDLVANHPHPLRQGDLVERSGLPRATTIRLLATLCDLSLLRIDRNGEYVLGPRVASWGQHFIDSLDVAQLGADLLEELSAFTQETAFMGVLDDHMVLYVATALSPQAVRPAANVGYRNPLHCTGIGKALLAHLPADERTALLDASGELIRKTENTITDRAQLLAQLDEAVHRGHTIDDIENEPGVRCVAAPVFDHEGSVAAAISVSAPAYRFSLEDVDRLAPRVRAAADELSTRMGFRGASADHHAARRKETSDASG